MSEHHILGTYDLNQIKDALNIAADLHEAEVDDDPEVDQKIVHTAQDMRALAKLFEKAEWGKLWLK